MAVTILNDSDHRKLYFTGLNCLLNLACKKTKLVYLYFKFYVMKGFKINIEKATAANGNFRKVLYTAPHSQLVLMNLNPKEEIGEEVHRDNDQFFRIEAGQGKCVIDDSEYKLKDGDAIVIPAGAKHNIINTSKTAPLKMYTMYSPAHHKDGIVRVTKQEAEANEEEFDGVTTEAVII
jgi:mannose-6-phosphate isomerase-like protein (cupin superfamily)